MLRKIRNSIQFTRRIKIYRKFHEINDLVSICDGIYLIEDTLSILSKEFAILTDAFKTLDATTGGQIEDSHVIKDNTN